MKKNISDVDAKEIARIKFIEEDGLLHDDTWKPKKNSELERIAKISKIAKSLDKRDALTICAVVVRRYTLAYIQVLAEYVLEEVINRKRGQGNEQK